MNTYRQLISCTALIAAYILLFSSLAMADFKKTKIAVLDFELRGNEMATGDMGGIVAEWFTTTMVQAGRFEVIERAMLQKILNEQKLAMMGIVDENSASKLGKVLGVENVITGSLLNFKDRVEVNARIIDVESGSIVAAENVTGPSTGDLQELVTALTKRIVFHFPMTGYIVKKKEQEVIIDLGLAAGLTIGMEFVVFKEGEVIKHPKTGEVLDVEQIHTGRIKITTIRDNVAEAAIINEEDEGISYGQMVQSVRATTSSTSMAQQSAASAAPPEWGYLTIVATPEDAEIRILNIGPKYIPGIKLHPGRYHIEVAKPSYMTKTQWIELPPNESSAFPITLEEIPTQTNTSMVTKTAQMPLPAEEQVDAGPSQDQPPAPVHTPTGYRRAAFAPGEQDNLASGGQAPPVLPLPAGSYMMGGNRFTEKPRHHVTIGQSVLLMTTEVTFGDYMKFCKDTGHVIPDDFSWGKMDRPVINVSWEDAQEYAKWLTRQTGFLYRLPYETEWEWAAKTIANNQYSWGNSWKKNQANCKECGSRWDNEQTAPVRSFAPNDLGFFDLAGNVWEWVQDCWVANYNKAPDDQSERTFTGKCTNYTVRGGAWNSPERQVTTASRLGIWGNTKSNYIGFRLVKDPYAKVEPEQSEANSAPVVR